FALDHAIEVYAHHVETGRGAPVAQKSRLDVLPLEWLLQEGIVEEVDLPDRKGVQGPPVGVHLAQFIRGKRPSGRGLAGVFRFPSQIRGRGGHGSFLVLKASSLVDASGLHSAATQRALGLAAAE